MILNYKEILKFIIFKFNINNNKKIKFQHIILIKEYIRNILLIYILINI